MSVFCGSRECWFSVVLLMKRLSGRKRREIYFENVGFCVSSFEALRYYIECFIHGLSSSKFSSFFSLFRFIFVLWNISIGITYLYQIIHSH